MASTKKFTAKAYPQREYQEPGPIVFPKELPIAFAVCSVKCGGRQLIVDGGTQVCEYCGRSMFRTEVRTYSLQPEALKVKGIAGGKNPKPKKEPNSSQPTSRTRRG